MLVKRSIGTLALPAYRSFKRRRKYGGYGLTAFRYARKIQRKYRSHRSRIAQARQIIGAYVGKSTAKVFQTNQTFLTYNSRFLYAETLNVVPKNAQIIDDENTRNRDLCNIRGVKMCWEIRNNFSDTILMNIAVVVPRNKDLGDDININFFRNQGNNAQFGGNRARDFTASMTSNEYHCLPINTDEWAIMSHKRYRIQGTSNNITVNQNGSNYFNLNRYTSIKRQQRFDGVSDVPVKPIYVVFWFCEVLSGASASQLNNVVQMSQRNLVYFREPK